MPQRRSPSGRIRLSALYAAVGVLLALARPVPLLLAAGAGLAALGEAIRLWAAGHLVKSSRLVTSGPYAFVRHPLHLGRLLILTGFLLAAWTGAAFGGSLLALSWAGFFLYYMPRKERVEGSRLLRRHGAVFAAYRSSVPALLPAARRAPASRERWSCRRMLASGEPRLAAALALLFGLLAWRTGLL